MMAFPLLAYLGLKALAQPTPSGGLILFQSDNGKDQLRIPLQHFLFANSSKNYVAICYQGQSGSKNHLIRKPLKAVEDQLKACPEIVRIHRSYLVNTTKLQAVKQHKGKTTVEINGMDLPVSNQFVDQLRRSM